MSKLFMHTVTFVAASLLAVACASEPTRETSSTGEPPDTRTSTTDPRGNTLPGNTESTTGSAGVGNRNVIVPPPPVAE